MFFKISYIIFVVSTFVLVWLLSQKISQLHFLQWVSYPTSQVAHDQLLRVNENQHTSYEPLWSSLLTCYSHFLLAPFTQSSPSPPCHSSIPLSVPLTLLCSCNSLSAHLTHLIFYSALSFLIPSFFSCSSLLPPHPSLRPSITASYTFLCRTVAPPPLFSSFSPTRSSHSSPPFLFPSIPPSILSSPPTLNTRTRKHTKNSSRRNKNVEAREESRSSAKYN